ncbi:hypothetical protein ACFVXE_38940 [Streptomyces sp. NPDC058231]|uniref:hypothetical protein n=1 Tax=Streptomyces sp. NPDC058231 TaxID=3346392 RepID=UPI0036E8DD91
MNAWRPKGWPVQHEIFSLPIDELPHRILRDDGPRLAWFAHLEPAVARIGEAKGWSHDVRDSVTLTLEGVVATHEAGTPSYSASRVAPLADGNKRNVTRTIELLAELGRLDDDRADPLDQWLERNLACLPTGIRTDVADWMRSEERQLPPPPQSRTHLEELPVAGTADPAALVDRTRNTP